jgi:SAM-dependent methyltransferase
LSQRGITGALAEPSLQQICAGVEAYYDAKLARHGATPRGVDWTCTATQWLRFVQLLKLCSVDEPFSLIDLGCGYGALADFLRARHPRACVDYLGIDLSPRMIRSARRLHRGTPSTRFAIGRTVRELADYTVASGVMNVRGDCPVPLWEGFVQTILTDMRHMSKRGFAVNFVLQPTSSAPVEQLYYPDRETWPRFCRETFGCAVEVFDDYGMQEFTLIAQVHPPAPVGRT